MSPNLTFVLGFFAGCGGGLGDRFRRAIVAACFFLAAACLAASSLARFSAADKPRLDFTSLSLAICFSSFCCFSIFYLKMTHVSSSIHMKPGRICI